MTLDLVRTAYAARSAEYIASVGSIDQVAKIDRDLTLAWARGLHRGRCSTSAAGPGQWTDLLSAAGVDAEGVDPVPEFIDSVRASHPSDRYRVGRAEDLGVDDAALAGVLARYSLIHTEPELIDVPLAEFARCVRSGGGLALGFCAGARLEPFEHAVTTAYFWPIDQLAARVEAAGFTVSRTATRAEPGTRPHGALLAVRR
ncbi:MAG: class I SAM-dependent methyltransferase [Micropruina sp.]|uniref:class I SAM-dependent methyltransferase n=1 Tax=Micropruina sp. TaxID=2737536 RepID=UPI0039E4BB0C